LSSNAIYVTYEVSLDLFNEIYLDIINQVFPSSVTNDFSRILSYNISDYSKQYEIQLIINNYLDSLSSDEYDSLMNTLNDLYEQTMFEKRRDLQRTGIIKVDFDSGDLSISAANEVPGSLLNQFSLDEFNNHLRVATTVGSWNTSNDVYVLDSSLGVVGSVLDLGVSERIYSVRFIGELGYVVTYRQVDPFYVLDLSNPSNPELKGELKIPGYSSYLHPISDSLILGIGREGRNLKASLFDVSSPSNPVENGSPINLSTSWSEALYNHRAFLNDEANELFFIPAGDGAYFISYAGGSLEQLYYLSMYNTRRAVYINDVMYVISNSKVVSLNESSWELLDELNISETIKPIYLFDE
jgi:uncharacterized secreted protein with C-terminal beta-propeller domain